MALTRKDAVATILTVLVVLTFVAAHQGWDVPLIGDSHRWAAAAILLLGALTCALGERMQDGRTASYFAVLGTIAAGLAVVALATGSLTALSLLVSTIVLLWAGATLRHALHGRRTPLTT